MLSSRAGFFAVFLVACVANVARIGTPWLSISGAVYLFPYFLAGLYCTRFPLELKNPRTLGYLVLAIIVLVLIFFGSQFEESRRSPAALVIGMLSCLALYLARPKSHWLAAIGFYSYSIYLFHVFFTAASRIALSKGGLTEIWLLFILEPLPASRDRSWSRSSPRGSTCRACCCWGRVLRLTCGDVTRGDLCSGLELILWAGRVVGAARMVVNPLKAVL